MKPRTIISLLYKLVQRKPVRNLGLHQDEKFTINAMDIAEMSSDLQSAILKTETFIDVCSNF